MLALLSIGPFELVMLGLVAVMLFGGDLPLMMRKAGRMIGRVRRLSSELSRMIDDAADETERLASPRHPRAEEPEGEGRSAGQTIGPPPPPPDDAEPAADTEPETDAATASEPAGGSGTTRGATPAGDSETTRDAEPAGEPSGRDEAAGDEPHDGPAPARAPDGTRPRPARPR